MKGPFRDQGRSIPAGGLGEVEVLNVVSLFAGIGGFELGLERAGMTVVAQCEINPKCRHLLRHHWPDVQQFDDVCTMTAADVPHRVDVICGGFPCQDISFAGKGAGLAGERSGLWREYARLVREFRPRFVIVENVAALLGRGLGDVLGDLAALGYDAWWDCIPASAVGAPHRRDRLWVVAYARGEQHEGYGDALRREIASGLSRAAALYGFPAGHGGEADAQRADADRVGRDRAGVHVLGGAELRNEQIGDAEQVRGDVADANGVPQSQERKSDGFIGGQRPALRRRQQQSSRTGAGGAAVGGAHAGRDGGNRFAAIDARDDAESVAAEARAARHQERWDWSAEPDVGRVAHGVPARVDRLHGLGNAVVPQIPEILGRAIIGAMSASQRIAA